MPRQHWRRTERDANQHRQPNLHGWPKSCRFRSSNFRTFISTEPTVVVRSNVWSTHSSTRWATLPRSMVCREW